MTQLSAEERKKFACWLREEAASTDALIKQAEKLTVVPKMLLVKLRAEAISCVTIAYKLENIEEQTIGA